MHTHTQSHILTNMLTYTHSAGWQRSQRDALCQLRGQCPPPQKNGQTLWRRLLCDQPPLPPAFVSTTPGLFRVALAPSDPLREPPGHRSRRRGTKGGSCCLLGHFWGPILWGALGYGPCSLSLRPGEPSHVQDSFWEEGLGQTAHPVGFGELCGPGGDCRTPRSLLVLSEGSWTAPVGMWA